MGLEKILTKNFKISTKFPKISQNLKFTPHKITWVNGQINSVAQNMSHDVGDTDKIIRIIIFELAWFDITYHYIHVIIT